MMMERAVRNRKRLLLLAAGWIAVGAPIYGQVLHVDGSLPSFEVATIKPSDPNPKGPVHFGGLLARNCTIYGRSNQVEKLISFAYNISPFTEGQRLLGGPAWIHTSPYDIDAKAEDEEGCRKLPPVSQNRQMRLMMQSLLENRFQLKVHFENRELPIFALVVAKGGPKLTPVPAPWTPESGKPQPSPRDPNAKPTGIEGHGAIQQLTENATTISGCPELVLTCQTGLTTRLLQFLPELNSRPIADQTEALRGITPFR